MWTADVEASRDGRTLRHGLCRGGESLTRGEVLRLWREEPEFARWFAERLAGSPHEAFFFETPPVTRATLAEPFEFVLVDAPQLAEVRPEPRAFADHFRARELAATFPNLGGDAWLVAPTAGEDDACAHLAAFVRRASPERQLAFWSAVASLVEAQIGETPLWLSTSGLGVSWLHARLDTRPKYYQHALYRDAR